MNASLLMLFPTVMGVLAFLFGGLFFVTGIWSRRKAGASRGWPTAPGRVISSEVKANRHRARYSRWITVYQPVIEYDYNVTGVPYHANRWTFGSYEVSQLEAEAAVARFPAGAEIQVFYNPRKPEEAVLEHAASGTGLFVIVGGVFALFGLCVACFGGVFLTSAK